MPDKSFTAPYFAIFVDGEFRGIYAGEEKAKSVNLKNGNKVTVARVLQPQILNEASSGMDSTNWVWGDASRSEYQENIEWSDHAPATIPLPRRSPRQRG